MLFTNVKLNDDAVHLRTQGDRITAISLKPLPPIPGETVVTGGRITPPLAEPHTHLDATGLAAVAPNVSGTLREGIANWAKLRPGLTVEDVQTRARKTLSWYADWGALRVRTHVDTGSRIAVEALLDLRTQVAAEGITLEVVAFPQEGILRAPSRRADWEWAVAQGCDAVGAIPHFERTALEGWESVKLAFALAESVGAKVDMHIDETDDPGSRSIEVACAQAIDRGMGAATVLGHCTALHSYPNPYAAKLIELIAESGATVVTNPLDNVVLQGRYDGYPKRRGITRVDELWAAGVHVGIGHDSVMDPWYPLGQANLMDAASMLAHVGHLTGTTQMERIVATLWTDNHRPFGDVPVLCEGGEATFLWWPTVSLTEILRLRPRPAVINRGEKRAGGVLEVRG
ncbi:MAG: cytosine deaminase [Myxococcota bacterium]|jgi:cytosine deaminase